MVVGVSDNDDLKRLVRVEVRRHYEYKSFKANDQTNLSNVRVAKTQGSDLKIEFVLPDEFSEALLPITFKALPIGWIEMFCKDSKSNGEQCFAKLIRENELNL